MVCKDSHGANCQSRLYTFEKGQKGPVSHAHKQDTHSLMLLVQAPALVSQLAPLLFKLLDPLKAAARANTASATMLLTACRPVKTVCEWRHEVQDQIYCKLLS